MTFYHTPTLFKSTSKIQAGFTYANKKTVNISGHPSGLNLGDNTGSDPEEIKRNFDLLSDSLGWNSRHFALAEQVHGGDVEIVSKPGFYEGIDGLITNKARLAVAVKVADCAGLLFADPITNIVAAVHAGWRGAVADIVPTAIQKMQKMGVDTSKTLVYVSPCISLKQFEVGEEVAEQFPAGYINREIGKKPHLDLKSFLKDQLLKYGIVQNHLEMDPRCTIEDEHFYSFRRERKNAGRMLAFIRHN